MNKTIRTEEEVRAIQAVREALEAAGFATERMMSGIRVYLKHRRIYRTEVSLVLMAAGIYEDYPMCLDEQGVHVRVVPQ